MTAVAVALAVADPQVRQRHLHNVPTAQVPAMCPSSQHPLLLSRYQLERKVARGGMSEIWQATDQQHGGTVAVKRVLITVEPKHHQRYRKRLLREARALQGIAHPNIVRCLDVGFDHEEQPFLVLEWLRGESLDRRQRRDPVDLQTGLDIARQTLAGLAACHARGVVHRDVKPGNLFLVSADQGLLVKVLDLGLAWLGEHLTRLTRTGTVLGTVYYMAPEQVRGDPDLDHRADIYAVGVVLYRLATGKLPFADTAPHKVMRMVLSDTPQLPSLVRPELPQWVEEVILRAMMRAPQDRFGSASEMLSALGGQPPPLPPQPDFADATTSPYPADRQDNALAHGSTDQQPAQATGVPPDLAGQLLAGTYRVTRRIAAGGMGAVYEAQHIRLSWQRFAIKVLHPAVRDAPEAYSRFRREAQIAAALGHPNIIHVLDLDETEQGQPFMVMELLSGQDMGQLSGPLEPGVLLRIMEQVGSALEAAHGRGIVHRDIKPANIYLAGDPQQLTRRPLVKVLDFGISKIRHGVTVVTRANTLLGSLHYMSPEQATGEVARIDHTTDIFALGVICYEALTGTRPFYAPTAPGVLYKICNEDPPPVTSVRADLPAALDPVLARAMAKQRDQRFQSVAALVQGLADALGPAVLNS